MQTTSTLESVLRGIAITAIILFFMFPILWIFLMSFQTNETILRVPPSLFFEPTLTNYRSLISGKLEGSTATLEIRFMSNLYNSLFLSVTSVTVGLILGVPAAYAADHLLSANWAGRHIWRPNLGLPVDRSATDPVDCARLF